MVWNDRWNDSLVPVMVSVVHDMGRLLVHERRLGRDLVHQPHDGVCTRSNVYLTLMSDFYCAFGVSA